MNSKTEHIKWIDGLKGIACLGVFLHHLFMNYYPAYITGNNDNTLLYGIDTALCNTPLGIIINGNFWVCIFFAVSAYVLALQLMKCTNENLRKKSGSILVKRYFRLAIPMVSIGIINYIIMKILINIGVPFYSDLINDSLFTTLHKYLVTVWITPNANVFGQLWAMHYLFMAAPVVILLTIFDRKETKYASLIYLILLYPFALINEGYIAIIMGIIFADLTYFNRLSDLLDKNKKLVSLWNNNAIKTLIILLLLATGIYLGGYPSNTLPVGIYGFLLPLDNRFPFFSGYMHGLSVIFILCGLYLIKKHIILESGLIQSISKYSFAIYMTHGFLILYFCPNMYAWLKPYSDSHNMRMLILFIITSILLAVISFIFNKTVERFTNYICRKL